MSFLCSSRITHVTVHARGAVITRAVDAPPVAGGEVELVVPDVTVLADGGSVRATIGGTRRVVAVRTALHVPEAAAQRGEGLELLRALEGRIERLTAEKRRLGAHRGALVELDIEPRLRLASRRPGHDVAARAADALAASTMVAEVLARLDQRAVEIEEALRELERQLEAAKLVVAQQRSRERMGVGHPTRRISVTLAGEGPVSGVELSYVVPAARWWPTYTLRLRDDGTSATWSLEAVVAQLSGEDWSDVALSLSTADLISDARLPELASRRLGRAQPAARRAYRPAPAGLELMFGGYDRAFAGLPWSGPPATKVAAPAADDAVDYPDEALRDSDEEVTRPGQMASGVARGAVAYGGPPAPPSFALPAPGAASPSPMMTAPQAPRRSLMMASGSGAGPAAEVAVPAAIEPGDAWLDFDGLTLAGVDDAQRGRLVAAAPGVAAQRRSEAQARLESLTPDRLRDPLSSRGQFDHRYDSPGGAEVPSDGLPHRVTLQTAETTPTLRWRSVPREAPEVYREASLVNPFGAPLLAGPVDVYVEGSLLATTAIDRVDRGGRVAVGMGVEERIRVARVARVEESSGGLMRGSTIIETHVTVELASSLAAPARVEVVDRIPVTDDKGLEITLEPGAAKPEPYSQAERDAPLRRGLLWTVDIPPGGKSQLTYRYVITFPSKSELVGGNRRE